MEKQSFKFGFNPFNELWNGRLAMLGFVIGLATELLTGQSVLGQLGLM
ncbi:high light inducible protein [filamentous cyanobacterium LEGE 11480]|uniref:High light inducible protein n=1 Tax=Romeriopsis navalis LEGE 11480 TaxID=2777977 RepID=A0A928VRL8_9CYAN|nr:chlorophyll a/b-binding protein [Romeriopsis navalis]MBE9032472.1 high light inducible protein [Romeriopsis navalis LEGE 11480]